MYRPFYSGVAAALAGTAILIGLGYSAALVEPTHPPIQRMSVDAGGREANDDSSEQFISRDGRYVVFTSQAENLVPGDSNGFADVFLVDRVSGTIEKVSTGDDESQLNGNSEEGMVSADGRFAVFGSYASNAVVNDRNATWDIFVRDRQAGTTERVSVSGAEAETNDSSAFPSISADGRYVAFHSWAGNLVAGDTNAVADMFVRDRQAGTTERVSLSGSEGQGNGHSQSGYISDDARYVGFYSFANNLVASDTNNTNDVFLRDRTTGTTERISVSSAGAQGNNQSQLSAMSPDSRFIVFSSSASNLVTGDNNTAMDVFVRDRLTSVTERVSVPWPGLPPEALPSQGGSISANGRFVTFWSTNTYLVPGDTNLKPDVFLRDRQLSTTERVNLNTNGGQSVGGGSWGPFITADGTEIVFSSLASDLVEGDTNSVQDIFLRTGDGDGDSVPDEDDNCPAWPNSSQALPSWPVPANDPDCDGLDDSTESHLGTDPARQCPATSVLNDEPVDAWPADFNDNRLTNLTDVSLIALVYNRPTGTDPAMQRFDLNASGTISLPDVALMGPFYNKPCS